jgi:hypothetical protein
MFVKRLGVLVGGTIRELILPYSQMLGNPEKLPKSSLFALSICDKEKCLCYKTFSLSLTLGQYELVSDGASFRANKFYEIDLRLKDAPLG